VTGSFAALTHCSALKTHYEAKIEPYLGWRECLNEEVSFTMSTCHSGTLPENVIALLQSGTFVSGDYFLVVREFVLT
jgi:hypothetical protein